MAQYMNHTIFMCCVVNTKINEQDESKVHYLNHFYHQYDKDYDNYIYVSHTTNIWCCICVYMLNLSFGNIIFVSRCYCLCEGMGVGVGACFLFYTLSLCMYIVCMCTFFFFYIHSFIHSLNFLRNHSLLT